MAQDASVWIAFVRPGAEGRRHPFYGGGERIVRKPMPLWARLLSWITILMQRYLQGGPGAEYSHSEIIVRIPGREPVIAFSAMTSGVVVQKNAGVHTRPFSSEGWKFISIPVGHRDAVERLAKWLLKQHGKGYNNAGGSYHLFYSPQSGEGREFFCSELICEGLKQIGYMPSYVVPEATSVAMLYNYLVASGLGVDTTAHVHRV